MRSSIAFLLVLASPAGPVLADAEVDYARDVKPILAKHCALCHGPVKPRAGLRLDTAALALKGAKSGPVIVPGKAEESALIDAVIDEDPGVRMPLNRPALPAQQIEILRAWIDQGAKAPADEAPASSAQTHWAFVPPERPALPAVRNQSWVRNAIDHFILVRLEHEGIAPSPEADRTTLIRRLSLDLVGLPPSPEEVDAFVADPRPDAYERLVDRLLSSPHHGERRAREWLDMARYADSNGFNIDAPRTIWLYRDWVIDAFNRDMPYDQFALEQLAGDLLPGATTAQKIATGFHRNTPLNEEGGIDLEQFRVESVVDRVNTTATVFLGLTMACAQCHDHKYDPISQREYYGFFAFFNNCDEPDLAVGSPEALARRHALRAQTEALEKERANYVKTLKGRQEEWEESLGPDDRKKLKPEVQAILEIPADKRNPTQTNVAFAAFEQQDVGWRERTASIEALTNRMPAVPTTMVVAERPKPRETHVHIQGDFTRPGDRVSPGVPAVLNALEARGSHAPNRVDLARWLGDPQNPLTARVAVNRLWQSAFSKGLVETENDFGTQGAPPSHPELLDWLASELIERGWSLRTIEREIVCSATYRQSSRTRPDLAQKDPQNHLLARQSRLRLEAEAIRDAALFASGLLARKIGGPSVFPPQPDGVMTLGQLKRDWETSAGPNRYRRGLYTFFWRATPHPALLVFDAPESTRTCTRRNRSNTPLQALTLLNDQGFFELARALAERVLRQAPADDTERLRLVFRLCLARTPEPIELDRLKHLLAKERADREALPTASKDTSPACDPAQEAKDRAAYTTVARVLMNLDEFITRE
jgi:hypothetical protein